MLETSFVRKVFLSEKILKIIKKSSFKINDMSPRFLGNQLARNVEEKDHYLSLSNSDQ
jgi:hypothetical protein